MAGKCGALIALSPKPAKDRVFVSGLTGQNTMLMVDALAKIMTNVTTPSAGYTLHVHNLAAGTYMIRIVPATGGAFTNLRWVKK